MAVATAFDFTPWKNRRWSQEEIELLDQLACAEARESFWAFRRYLRPDMKVGWWIRDEVARNFQLFYRDFVAGRKPRMVVMSPPQHGKSWTMIDFAAWLAGKNPDLREMYASYSDDLGVFANSSLQRILDSPSYQRVFPNTRINTANVSSGGRYQRNSYMLEYIGHRGSFRNTTVRGQINGFGLDVGMVDDPMKGREEAQSQTIRDKTWAWFTDDFFGRFSENAGLIMMMTRWHVDDPLGRWLERYPDTRVVKFPAIATKDEKYRKKGEPLFPELKSLEFLLERKSLLTSLGWESLYQQEPFVQSGGMFPIDRFHTVNSLPLPKEVKRSVRYWDKAGTQDGGAYSCGVLLHALQDGRTFISDVQRGQWNSFDREARIKQTCEIDRATWGYVQTWVEQEPGSGGKESAERTVANCRGFNVKADRVTGSKEIRAEPYAAQVQGGNVMLRGGAPWIRDFLDEHESFPNGRYRDQVDAAAGSFNKSALGYQYDASLKWVG